MKIYADSTCFASLYDATPKLLLLGSPGLMMPAVSNDQIRRFASYCDREGRLVVVPADRQLVSIPELLPLQVPPANVWAVWIPTIDDQDAMGPLMQWWAAEGGETGLPALVPGDRVALDEVLLARALDEGSRLAHANERLMCDLAALRESFEHHVRIPHEVEEVLENLRLAPLRLVFTSPAPIGGIVVPMHKPFDRPPGEGATVRQRLPMSTRGFAGLDLYIEHPGFGEGLLCLDLKAQDEGLTLARWRVPLQQLRQGLLPLRVARTMARPWRSLELHVAAEGTGDPPSLAIGSAGLLPEYSLIPATGGPLPPESSMLTVRLWGGLPGTVTGRGGASVLKVPSPDPVIPIDEFSIAGVRLTREINASYPCFGYLGGSRVLLRPLPNKVSAAAIALPTIPYLSAVSCSVAVDEKRCQTRQLSARLVVMPPGRGPDEAERGEGALAASEWVELDHPLEARALKACLSEPYQGPLDIHLFTRLPKGGAIEHVRMVFQNFEAELWGGAIEGMPTLLACGEEAPSA